MTRKPIALEALQAAISKAVKEKFSESFVGVFLERVSLGSKDEANWSVRGVSYGKCDRARCDAVLAPIVEQYKSEFIISDAN